MATVSDVKTLLDEVSVLIKRSRLQLTAAKAMVTSQEEILNNIPTRYEDLVTTINAYTPDGAFETLAKDELAQLTAEFQALLAAATSAKVDLATQTEF